MKMAGAGESGDVGGTGYRLERCTGAECSTFTLVATPPATSYTDTALAPSTSYSYRVKAVDAAGNVGAASPVASATTSADTTPPTAPASLTATASTSAYSISLSWAAATDDVGVTGYRLERCTGAECSTFTLVATPTATSYTDTALAPSTSYSYRVKAVDAASTVGGGGVAAGNSERPAPPAATASTSADTTPPSAPTGLTAAAASATQISLTWAASTDDVGVTGYRVERCQGAECTTFTPVATPPGTSDSDTGLSPITSYSYRVKALDAAGNVSTASAPATASTLADTTPPSAPATLTVTAASATQISLTWAASTDDVGVTGYGVERCTGADCASFTPIATPTGTTYSDTGLSPSTSYSYQVRAGDAAGNVSGGSPVARATTASAGTTERGSVDNAGTEGDGASTGVALSADGRFVVFTSVATNLVAGGADRVSH